MHFPELFPDILLWRNKTELCRTDEELPDIVRSVTADWDYRVASLLPFWSIPVPVRTHAYVYGIVPNAWVSKYGPGEVYRLAYKLWQLLHISSVSVKKNPVFAINLHYPVRYGLVSHKVLLLLPYNLWRTDARLFSSVYPVAGEVGRVPDNSIKPICFWRYQSVRCGTSKVCRNDTSRVYIVGCWYRYYRLSGF